MTRDIEFHLRLRVSPAIIFIATMAASLPYGFIVGPSNIEWPLLFLMPSFVATGLTFVMLYSTLGLLARWKQEDEANLDRSLEKVYQDTGQVAALYLKEFLLHQLSSGRDRHNELVVHYACPGLRYLARQVRNTADLKNQSQRDYMESPASLTRDEESVLMKEMERGFEDASRDFWTVCDGLTGLGDPRLSFLTDIKSWKHALDLSYKIM